ncbi:MAG: prenyltransferase [Hyphobacterium sp.]|nr:MAG: prenyltransferase [Hyphobacterium sp.]
MSALISLAATAQRIEALQREDGSIPWVEAGLWDPWNHGESAMALAVVGRHESCERALDALFDRQEADGGWTGELGAGVPLDENNRRLVVDNPATARDTNFTGYAAVTVLRSALALNAPGWMDRYAAPVRRAMDFILSCQTPEGDFIWRKPDAGEDASSVDSLRAGNACLYKSLECAIRLETALGGSVANLTQARSRLAEALHDKDWRFDRKSTDRRRYAMDWYYPVLSGVHSREESIRRLEAGWSRYVIDGLGCRCVADEPWVTAAETAELALACQAVGWSSKAHKLISDLAPLAARSGGYWMGWQFEEEILWPYERPSWTSAAVILAADAIEHLSPGSDLLVSSLKPIMASRRGAKPPAS